MLGLVGTRTDVKKGGAEWTDGRRKPRCREKEGQSRMLRIPIASGRQTAGCLVR